MIIPFSSEPAIFNSYHASMYRRCDDDAGVAELGLCANARDRLLLAAEAGGAQPQRSVGTAGDRDDDRGYGDEQAPPGHDLTSPIAASENAGPE